MSHKTKSLILSLFISLFSFAPSNTFAIPIATDVALPVSKGETVYRLQSKKMKPEGAKESYIFPFAFAHGLSPKTVLIGVLPYKSTDSTSGLVDISFNLRHTVYQRDSFLRTSRFALLGGIKLPTGSDEFTSESTDWRFGGVYTLQDNRHEIDASLVYSINTEAEDAEKGDTLAHDISYQLRISPWNWPDSGVPAQFNFVVELNGLYTQKDEISGIKAANTGGYKLFISPGFQWVSQQFIIEGLFQRPVVQDLNGNQMEEDYRAILGVRFQM